MSKLSSTANFLRARVMPPLRRRCASVSSTRRPSGMNGMSRQRQYQLRHKSAGLCYHCSRPVAHGTLFCELHRRKRNLENRERQRKRFKRKIRYHKAESYKFKGAKPMSMSSEHLACIGRSTPPTLAGAFPSCTIRSHRVRWSHRCTAITAKMNTHMFLPASSVRCSEKRS